VDGSAGGRRLLMSVTVITLPGMSVAVITDRYDPVMVRWEPDSRGRLEKAAFELYRDRGFDRTTVAEIAERAGVTERTFFRHFADKREILFSGAGQLQALLVDAVVEAPADASPFEAVRAALETAGAFFDDRREFARQRQTIILGSEELRERELIKLATLAAALADALRRRGADDQVAALTGEVAIAVFRVAFEAWIGDDGPTTLTRRFRDSFDAVQAEAART
jgi:AcrR family transcriptional regulator